MAYNIGPKIGIEGEAEYRKQMNDIIETLKVYDSEIKLLSVSMDENGDKQQSLAEQNEVLAKTVDAQTQRLELYKKMLAASSEAMGENDKSTKKWQQSVNYATADLKKSQAQLNANNKELDKFAQEIEEVTDITASSDDIIAELNSEIRLLKESSGDAGDAVSKLREENELLSKVLQEQKKKVDGLEQELKASAAQTGETSKATIELKTKLNEARSAVIKTEKAISNNTEAMEAGEKEGKEFGNSLNDVLKETGLASDDLVSHILDIGDNFKKARESGVTSSDAMKAAIAGGLIPIISELVGKINEVGTEYENMTREFDESMTETKLALGLTTEEAEKVKDSIEDIYKSGLADTREQATEAMTPVIRLLGQEGEEAQKTTEKVLTLGKVFGEDYTALVETASTMTKTFGISSDEAFDQIYAGLQSSANKGGELLDVLNEYSNSFERIGYSSDEFLSGLSAAADAGAYSIDKAADSVKEFYNKASDATDDYKGALSELGLDSDKTVNAILAGGERGKEAFQKVLEKLQGVKDETKQAQIAARLFGSQWEDVGTEAVLAFSKASKSSKEFGKDTQEATKELVNSSENMMKRFERTVSEIKGAIASALKNTGPLGQLKTAGKGIMSLFGYATGTSSATPGFHAVSEGSGPEIISAHGKQTLVPGPALINFQGGEQVLTASQSQAVMGNRNADVSVMGGAQSSGTVEAAAVMAHNDADRIVGLLMDIKNKLSAPAAQNNTVNVNMDPRSIKDIDQLLQYAEQAQIMRRKRGW